MKKYLKNIMISFLVIFFMLSFLNLIYQLIQQYFVIIPAMTELAESVKHTGISAEDSYQMIASAYHIGDGKKNEIQIQII